MGKRGPQPQPAELKKLRGNPGKRAIKEVPTAPSGVPPCPEELAHISSDWNHYGETLAGLGILRETDWPMYEALWRTWEKYSAIAKRSAGLNEIVDELGPETDPSDIREILKLISKIEPLELQYLASLIRLLDHFGMSPTSRGSVNVETKSKEPSEFERFMARDKKAN